MILSCGEALIDFVPRPGDEAAFVPRPGGSPFNLAIAARRLGAPAGFLGRISRDLFGEELFGKLAEEGVDCRYVARSKNPTTLAFVRLAEREEPQYAFFSENTADRTMAPSHLPDRLPDEVTCLEFGSISLLWEPQGDTIRQLVRREAGRRALSFDPNIRPDLVQDRGAFVQETEDMVGLSTIVKASVADLAFLYPGKPADKVAGEWLVSGAGLVVLTRGKDGGVLYAPSFRIEEPEYVVAVEDTIGAGDTFHAAFLVRLHEMGLLSPRMAENLHRDAARDALRFAVKASSLNCTRRGADPPTIAEMLR